MKNVGHELRNERERMGKQLDDVSLALTIRPNYLIAIEEGRFEGFPNRAFAIGYVARYARYLRLDAKNLVDRLDAELASRDGADNRPLEILPLPNRKLRLGATVVIGGLLLAALTYYRDDVVTFATRAYEQATEAGLAQNAVPAPALAPIEQRAPIAALESPIPLPTETAVTPVALPAEPAPSLQAPLPPGRQYGLGNKVSRITLRVHRPTLVAVRGVRNRDFLDRALAPGDTYRVPNVGGLTLTVGDAGAVEIILDGVSVGFVGAQGVAAKGLSLAPQSIINRAKRG